jgi:hypothetical protein
MQGKSYSITIKEHPIAIAFCGIYLLLWCWIAYIAYNDFKHPGGGEAIGMFLYYFFFVVFLPYLVIASLMALFSVKSKSFYWDMVGFILSFIPIAFLVSILTPYFIE